MAGHDPPDGGRRLDRSLTLEVPSGVAARIHSRMALGAARSTRPASRALAEGYESPDYASAANRVDIDISGGVGSVKVGGGPP